jgi:hypothetical protein
MPEPPAKDHAADDEDAAWRQERMDGLARVGTIIAAVGWFVAFLGVLIAIRWQGVLSQGGAQPIARLEALPPPLLLAAFGVGLAGLGHVLRIVPVMSGMPAPHPGTTGRPGSFAAFLRTMRSQQE